VGHIFGRIWMVHSEALTNACFSTSNPLFDRIYRRLDARLRVAAHVSQYVCRLVNCLFWQSGHSLPLCCGLTVVLVPAGKLLRYSSTVLAGTVARRIPRSMDRRGTQRAGNVALVLGSGTTSRRRVSLYRGRSRPADSSRNALWQLAVVSLPVSNCSA
jgi:hypothetical protein